MILMLHLFTQSAQAQQMSFNEKLARLLKMYYAYPQGKAQSVKSKIEAIHKKRNLTDRSSIKEELEKFENLHLYVMDKENHSKKNTPCVTFSEKGLKILSFWCNEKTEDISEIRTRFAREFTSSLLTYMEHLEKSSSQKMVIDLRGNGGGEDAQMELALFPFMNKGDHLYDYQFKLLSSPHILPRFIRKFSSLIGVDHYLGKYWDQRRSYYFDFNEGLWELDIIERLKIIKKRLDKSSYDIEILIDSETGSASELYAAILVDSKKATLKGSRSKGSAGAPQNYFLYRDEQNERSIEIAIPAVRLWRINNSPIEGIGLNP